jgi:predicted nucleic acid-binding protein
MPETPSHLLDSSACLPILRNKAGLGKLPAPARTGIPIMVAAELWAGVKKNMATHPRQAAKLQAFTIRTPVHPAEKNLKGLMRVEVMMCW